MNLQPILSNELISIRSINENDFDAFKFVYFFQLRIGDTNYRSQKAVEKLGAVKIGEIPDDTSPKTNWTYELKK